MYIKETAVLMGWYHGCDMTTKTDEDGGGGD